jgi:O-antigen/teichoic acid export membrane protein
MTDLAKAGVSAFKWSVASAGMRFSLQLGAQVVLARLLGPDNYGVFGIGMLVLTFTNFFSSFGFGWNLMQKLDLCEEDIRFAFTWQIITGASATLFLLLIAPLMADYFHDQRVVSVIRWMSLSCIIGAATSPASHLLQRDLNFRAIAIMQVTTYAIAYVGVGVPMAYFGAGVYALVAAALTQSFTGLLANYYMRPHSLKPLFRYKGMSSAMNIGATVFATNIVNWAIGSVDRVFLGRILNANSVGIYSVASNIASLPNSLLLGALQPSFMAAAARMQSEPERMARAYFQMLATICVLVMPLYIFFSCISQDLVRFLYGPQWTQTGEVMAILFVGMPAMVVWGVSTPVLWNTGRKHLESLLQVPVLLLGLAGFYFFTSYGATAVAGVASGLLFIRMLLICGAAMRALNIGYYQLVPEVMRGIIFSAICVGTVAAARWLLKDLDSAFANLAASSTAMLAVFAGVVWYFPSAIGSNAFAMLTRFVPALAKT